MQAADLHWWRKEPAGTFDWDKVELVEVCEWEPHVLERSIPGVLVFHPLWVEEADWVWRLWLM